MKIALFSDTYIPDINGVATSTNILRNELIKLGHDVLVVTSELPSDSDYHDRFDDQVLRVPGLEIQALYGYRACNIYSFKGMREIKRFAPEVIHVQTEFGIGIFGRIAGETLNVPVVYTYHTMWEDYSHYVNPINSETVDTVLKKVITKISQLYSNKCQELIVPSLKTKDALEHYGITQNHINIIPTGLELDRFDPANKNEQLILKLKKEYNIENHFVLTFLGRIAQEKSIDVIINALKEVVKVNKNIKCLIVGGGPQLEELKELVRDDDISQYIIFTGPQSGQLVPAHYHISDVFISASLSETQGLTYIEAMASGIPVIARYDDQLKDVVESGHNGYFFKEENELPELILKMMSIDLSSMKKNALETAKKYSGETFAKKVLEVYKNGIVNKHYSYTLKSIIPLRHHKNELVFSIDGSNISLELADQIIEQYDLKVGQVIDRELFDSLKDLEQVSRAYNKALKYLTLKDYTYYQMKTKLMNNGDFDDTQLDATLELLKEKNLINDKLFAMNYLQRCMRIGIGLNKAIYNLRSYQIDNVLIDQCLEEIDTDEEYEAAISLIETYYHRNNSFSHKNVIKKIREKLFLKGFTNETIEKAMSDYDFEYDNQKEKELLNKDFQKLFNKYSKKYSGSQFKNKLVDSLLRKGYNYDDIKKLIEKEEF